VKRLLQKEEHNPAGGGRKDVGKVEEKGV